MSRAFVKETDGERWQPPARTSEFTVHWGPNARHAEREAVYRADDLVAALRWLAARHAGYYQLRDSTGRLLAEVTHGTPTT